MNIDVRKLAINILDYISNNYEINCSKSTLATLIDEFSYTLAVLIWNAAETTYWNWNDWCSLVDDAYYWGYHSDDLYCVKDTIERFKDAIKQED